MKRRTVLQGITPAIIAGTAVPMKTTPADSDAQMLALVTEQRLATARYAAACLGGDDVPGAPRLVEARREEAYAAWEAVIDSMTAVPAEGINGLAAKASVELAEAEEGFSEASARLGQSMAADIARLCPGAVG